MEYFQVIGALILVVGGLLATLHLLKKYVPSMAGARDMSVVEQLHLGDRCRIVVVRVRGEELLIGVTRESISMLSALGSLKPDARNSKHLEALASGS